MSVLTLACDDVVSQVGTAVECSGNWLVVEVPDYVEFQELEASGSTFSIEDLEAAEMAGAYGAGFILVGMGWAVGFGVRLILDMIR